MTRKSLRNAGLGLIGLLALASLSLAPVSAASRTDAASQATLQRIINRGNNEISRRLSSLNNVKSRLNSAPRLNSDAKASLLQEVDAEITNLTSLKSKLAADTDLATARNDAQSIITDYRVYALIVPKVNLVRTADDQLAVEAKLTSLAGKLQARLTDDSPSSLKAALSDMTSKTSAAQSISSGVESAVLKLQPIDYNSDHNVLSGYRNQLKTAQTNIQAAVNDARTIVKGLKNQ